MKTHLSSARLIKICLAGALAATDSLRTASASDRLSAGDPSDRYFDNRLSSSMKNMPAPTRPWVPAATANRNDESHDYGNRAPTYVSKCWSELVEGNDPYVGQDNILEKFYFDVVRGRNISYIDLDAGRNTGTIGPMEVHSNRWLLDGDTTVRIYTGDHVLPPSKAWVTRKFPRHGYIEIIDDKVRGLLDDALQEHFGREAWSGKDHTGWGTINSTGIDIYSRVWSKPVRLQQSCEDSGRRTSPDDYILNTNLPLYRNDKKAIINNNQGDEAGTLMSNVLYSGLDGCYIACYLGGNQTAYSPTEGIGGVGQIRVPGVHIQGLCVPHGLNSEDDLSQVQLLDDACAEQFGDCAIEGCWAGGDTGGWFNL